MPARITKTNSDGSAAELDPPEQADLSISPIVSNRVAPAARPRPDPRPPVSKFVGRECNVSI